MPPYEKKLIEDTAKLTKENNKILRGMQRAAWWSRVFVFFRWIVVIAITLGAYFYIQPYLNTLLSLYSNLGKSVPGVNLIEGGLNLPKINLDKIRENLSIPLETN